ncbi:MAG: methyltransferase domain-containing protein [Thermoanaerobaculia bacterium]
MIDQLGLVQPGDRLLDIGCGTGVMVPGLLSRVGPNGSYVGFDVHRPAVSWCRRAYRAEPRCSFELARVASPYSTQRGSPIEQYSFPLADGQADFVLAKSVFTHLTAREASPFFREIHRTLRPGRAAVVTAFLFDKGSRVGTGSSRVFRWSDETGRMRWRSRLRPEAALAYERTYFFDLLEARGLRVQWFCPGFFPGNADRLIAQDVLILGH